MRPLVELQEKEFFPANGDVSVALIRQPEIWQKLAAAGGRRVLHGLIARVTRQASPEKLPEPLCWQGNLFSGKCFFISRMFRARYWFKWSLSRPRREQTDYSGVITHAIASIFYESGLLERYLFVKRFYKRLPSEVGSDRHWVRAEPKHLLELEWFDQRLMLCDGWHLWKRWWSKYCELIDIFGPKIWGAVISQSYRRIVRVSFGGK